MKIAPVTFRVCNYNQTEPKNSFGFSKVNFQAVKPELIPVLTDSFKTETAKKLYTKIQKFLKLIGDSGSIKDVKILSEEGIYYNHRINNEFYSKADIFLSINKNIDTSNLYLLQKYPENPKGVILLDATFNKAGQMVKGYFPPEYLYFERNCAKGANVRRMGYCNSDSKLLPIGGNDREWHGWLPNRVLNHDNSTAGAYEIFIEFARLYTSIFK